MIWWRRWPTHGERGLKPLEGRAAAAHVGCCVLWLCGCVVARVLYLHTHFVEKITQQNTNKNTKVLRYRVAGDIF